MLNALGSHELADGKYLYNPQTKTIEVQWVQGPGEPCDAVICAAPSSACATPDRQRVALALLRKGAALVAVCADRVFPSPRGLEFGSGALAAMMSYASGVQPIYCGKPERFFFVELCRRLNVEPEGCVLIGDNLESDIAGARAMGMQAILTLSGVTRRRDLMNLPPEKQPHWVIEDLALSRLRERGKNLRARILCASHPAAAGSDGDLRKKCPPPPEADLSTWPPPL